MYTGKLIIYPDFILIVLQNNIPVNRFYGYLFLQEYKPVHEYKMPLSRTKTTHAMILERIQPSRNFGSVLAHVPSTPTCYMQPFLLLSPAS